MQSEKLLFALLLISFSSCTSTSDITPFPLATSTTTPVEFSPVTNLSINQPEWSKDKNNNILLLSYGDMALFIDPQTKDTLFLTLPNAHWFDNNYVLFTSIDQFDIDPTKRVDNYVFDLKSWKIMETKSNASLISSTLHSIEDYPKIYLQLYEENTPFEIYNEQLRRWEVWLYPPQNLYNLKHIFADDKLFVVQGNSLYENGYVIAVYDLQTKEIIKTFVGNISQNIIRYSDERILYVVDDTLLCTINVNTLVRECGVAFPENFQKIMLDETIYYPEIIPFTYIDSFESLAFIRKLCLLDFLTGNIACPKNDTDILANNTNISEVLQGTNYDTQIKEYRSVGAYSVSPDGEFIVFCFSDSYHQLDEGPMIVGVHNDYFYDLGEIQYFPDFISYGCYRNTVSFTWRPLP